MEEIKWTFQISLFEASGEFLGKKVMGFDLSGGSWKFLTVKDDQNGYNAETVRFL